MADRRIAVLGVGNILYTDEGVGVHALRRLQQTYEIEGAELVDGGTLGMRLMDLLLETDMLIVIDAVQAGNPPGSLYRLTGDDLRKALSFRSSLHQTDLVDTLIYCELLGNRPSAVVVGVEPEDITTMGLELSASVAGTLDRLCALACDEIVAAGGGVRPKNAT